LDENMILMAILTVVLSAVLVSPLLAAAALDRS
jgi:hypothetical protein